MMTSLMLAVLCAVAQNPRAFVLEARTNVWDVETADMNGNGFQDILLLCSDEKAYPLDKEVALYLAGGDGAYPKTPSAVLKLDPVAGAVMLAEVDGAPPKEVVVLDAGGAKVFGFGNGDFEKRGDFRFNSLLPSNAREPVFLKRSAADLLGDGRDVWLIPTPSGLDLRRAGELVGTARCDVNSEMRRTEATHIVHRLPAVHPFSVPGGESMALAFLSDEFADFAHGPGWSENTRFKIPMNLEEKWDASARMSDITGNGLPDLVVTQTRGTVKMLAQTHVYLAEEPFKYPEKPVAEFSVRGGVSAPVLKDVDGDGKSDIILISIPFGVTNFVNYFVRGKLAIQAEVYLFNGKDFGARPTFSTNLTMDAPEGRERVAYTFGDFNGDGRLDVAFGKSDNTLVVQLGQAERFLSQRAWVTLKVPSFGIAEPHNLDGNPAQDIIIHHPGGKNAKRVEVILF